MTKTEKALKGIHSELKLIRKIMEKEAEFKGIDLSVNNICVKDGVVERVTNQIRNGKIKVD